MRGDGAITSKKFHDGINAGSNSFIGFKKLINNDCYDLL